jgi:Uma2 family endonuclease
MRRTRLGRVWTSPIDVVLDRANHLVVQPDLIVVAEPRLGIVTDGVWGAPDLAVEILSPRPRLGTLDERLSWFAQYGVRECWLVHLLIEEVEVVEFAAGMVAQRTRFGRDDAIRSGVLDEFVRTPAAIFEA